MNIYTQQRVEAQLIAVQARIVVAEAAILDMTAGGVASFELDTGESDQKIIFRNVQSFQKYLDGLYAKEEWLMRRLRGGTFTSIKTRRKP